MFQIFTRNWWKENPKYHRGLEPDGGASKTNVGVVETEEEARKICQTNNANRPTSWKRLSRKYEYTKA